MLPSHSSNTLDLRKFACSFFNIPGNQSLIDVGCGHGIELELLGNLPNSQNFRFIGLDSSLNSIRDCQTKFKSDSRYGFVVHDVDTPLPFPDKCFDYVYSRDLLECVTDIEKLAESGQFYFALTSFIYVGRKRKSIGDFS